MTNRMERTARAFRHAHSGESAYLTERQVQNMTEWRKAAVELAKQHPDQVFYAVADRKMVGLTFDDGPTRL